jgi:hypothetical protein
MSMCEVDITQHEVPKPSEAPLCPKPYSLSPEAQPLEAQPCWEHLISGCSCLKIVLQWLQLFEDCVAVV